MATTTLTLHEERRRNFIQNGDLWKVVLFITAPLAVYALFNYLYGFFDIFLVSHYIGTDQVASVMFIDDIKATIMAIGGGIAAGGTVFIARHYGAGDYEEARRHAGATLVLAVGLSVTIALLGMAFAQPLLKLLNAPDAIITEGLGYYLLQMASTVLIAFNAVYMGTERAKGNTKMILILNIAAMIVKIGLSALFVLALGLGTTYVALATLLAQGMLSALAFFVVFSRKNSIGVRLEDLTIRKRYALPILLLSLPVIAGRFLFSFGRVIVNSLATRYGLTALAAFGIAMRLGGGPGAIASIFEETTVSVASQNLGGKKLKRAFQTYGIANLYAILIAFTGMILLVLSIDAVIPWFTTEANPELVSLITQIFRYEKFSMISSSTIAIVAALFVSFKNTKVTFILNTIRVFALRVPFLILFLALDIGPVALGYAMFISNTTTAVIALVMIAVHYHKVRTFGYLDMRM